MTAKYAAARLRDKRIDRAWRRAQRTSARKRHYHLYIWRFIPSKDVGTVWQRGRCVGDFDTYKELVETARHRALMACYPMSRWMDLYDWNEGAR